MYILYDQFELSWYLHLDMYLPVWGEVGSPTRANYEFNKTKG